MARQEKRRHEVPVEKALIRHDCTGKERGADRSNHDLGSQTGRKMSEYPRLARRRSASQGRPLRVDASTHGPDAVSAQTIVKSLRSEEIRGWGSFWSHALILRKEEWTERFRTTGIIVDKILTFSDSKSHIQLGS